MWVKINGPLLHEGQAGVFESLFHWHNKSTKYNPRFRVVCCSRGWGKSYLAAMCAKEAIRELMELDDDIPNKNVYIIAPTYDQVMDIYYPLLMNEIGLRGIVEKELKNEGRFKFKGNVELRLLSYESIERVRGKGIYMCIWDEVSSCGGDIKSAWEGAVLPAMSTRWSKQKAKSVNAPSAYKALFISTPKGYNFFYDLFCKGETEDNWESFKFDYRTSPFLDQVAIENLKSSLDPLEFAREYEADFKESGNSVFYCFDRTIHVKLFLTETDRNNPLLDSLGLFQGETVHVCIDFNVGLQCSAAFVVRGDTMFFFREFKGHPDTETLAQVLENTFSGKTTSPNNRGFDGRKTIVFPHKILAYPDPSGRARKTSAAVGKTDFSILESHGIKCLARASSPSIVDSVAAVNRMLKTADGQVRMHIDPSCKGLITSLERTKWVEKPDTAVIDKSEGVEHFSDGVRYATEFLYPVNHRQVNVLIGKRF